jgi:hypothetical protein
MIHARTLINNFNSTASPEGTTSPAHPPPYVSTVSYVQYFSMITRTSLRALLSIPSLLYLRRWGTIVAISRRSTSAVTSGGRGWICCRLALHACALGGPGTVHAVVAQNVTPVQEQVREPRYRLQCGPAFRCKVVPHTVIVELNLRKVAVLGDAKGHVVGFSLGDVVFSIGVVIG